MTTVTLALDWTPNPIHAGFFVAQAKGWYRDAGLDVNFISPEADNYKTLPSEKVASGEVQLGICPSEFVIQSHYLGGGGKLIAVAALLQGSASAFATLESSGITRPAQLDGRKYAFYGLPFEHNILSEIIYMDGSQGTTTNISTPKLETWDRVLAGDADCTWIFKPIEGVEASHKGIGLHLFDPHHYGVPYGYAPVLVAHPDLAKAEASFMPDFMRATARGYHFAGANPKAAADLMLETAAFANKPETALFENMQSATAEYYFTPEGHWGTMTGTRWQEFVKWLEEQKLLSMGTHMPSHVRGTMQEVLFTNRFVEHDFATEV